ncbi:hypothetical protein CEQ90_10500 [Lewinellaceae bacterium SD302]|nr:hypothetical protein CEQ90_10500 [Lewinellaceae bacterium SD302]
MEIKHPNTISLLILSGIAVFAVIYAAITWREAPDNSSFMISGAEKPLYDLKRPDQTYVLPNDLDEISGLTFWEGNQVLTIQDEDGEVFIYDMDRQAIVKEIKFNKDRDYEGIARRDSTIFVLEKDGDVHYFNYRGGKDEYKADKFESIFSYRNDTEGICYDDRSGMLLIVPKGEQLDPVEEKEHLLGIYQMNPATGQILDQPAYIIDQYQLGEVIYGKRERYLMKPSGVAVHPETGNIYVIASVGKILVVLDRESNILQVELLDKKVFSQPEGITFTADNELLLSSEGKGTKPTITRFVPRMTAVEDSEQPADQ